MIKEDAVRPSEVFGDVLLSVRGRTLGAEDARPEALRGRDPRATITFAIGPAGTGKTYLAVATAVKALQDRESSASS